MAVPKRWARVATWVSVVVLLAVSLFLLGTGIRGWVRVDDLDTRGVEVRAEVVHADVDTGGDSGQTSSVTIRFKPRGDERARTTTEVKYDGDLEADHPEARRDGIRIEYDPETPAHARIKGESGDWIDRTIAGSVFTVLLVAFAIVYRKRPGLLGW